MPSKGHQRATVMGCIGKVLVNQMGPGLVQLSGSVSSTLGDCAWFPLLDNASVRNVSPSGGKSVFTTHVPALAAPALPQPTRGQESGTEPAE